MNCRNATNIDRDVLNQISLISKKYWGYPEAWIQKWENDLRLTKTDMKDLDILVGEIEERLIGFCAIQDQANYYEVVHLWLLPQFIGKGHGKILLQKALSKFTISDKPVWVTADPNAAAFYRKQGFVEFKKIESYPKGRFLPVMKRDSFSRDDLSTNLQ